MTETPPNNIWQGNKPEAWRKARLFRVALRPWWQWRPIYTRIQNAAVLYIGCLEIHWRLPVQPWVAWQMGYQAAMQDTQDVRSAAREGGKL